MIENTIQLLQSQADTKNIKLYSEVNEIILVKADYNHFSTILRNLVSNALKFTPRGGSIIVGSVNHSGEDLLTIYVKDTGIGIQEDLLINLFRLNATVSEPGTEGEKGTGLGLILCKEFVEKNGGKIYVESKPGEGSKFSFTLPITVKNGK